MLAIHHNRLSQTLAAFLGLRGSNKAIRRGPMPKWINDPQLSAQLLKDTGLSADDLGGQPQFDQTKPFFMQTNYW